MSLNITVVAAGAWGTALAIAFSRKHQVSLWTREEDVTQVMLAEASAEAIRRVSAAVGTESAPMLFLLGEKYIASLERIGSSESALVVVLPADLQEAVRGLIGGVSKR